MNEREKQIKPSTKKKKVVDGTSFFLSETQNTEGFEGIELRYCIKKSSSLRLTFRCMKKDEKMNKNDMTSLLPKKVSWNFFYIEVNFFTR